jgi:hypothetical protein
MKCQLCGLAPRCVGTAPLTRPTPRSTPDNGGLSATRPPRQRRRARAPVTSARPTPGATGGAASWRRLPPLAVANRRAYRRAARQLQGMSIKRDLHGGERHARCEPVFRSLPPPGQHRSQSRSVRKIYNWSLHSVPSANPSEHHVASSAPLCPCRMPRAPRHRGGASWLIPGCPPPFRIAADGGHRSPWSRPQAHQPERRL